MKLGSKVIIPTCQIPVHFAEARIPESFLGKNSFSLGDFTATNPNMQAKTESDGSHESLITLFKIWGIQENRLSQELAFWTNYGKTISLSDKARSFALEATQFKSNIEGIQLMNYPCIVEMRNMNDASKRYFATLIGLTPQRIVIADPWKGKITLSLEEFKAVWTNRVIIVWRNFDGINDELKKGDVQTAVRVLKKRMKETGLLKNYQPDDRFDEELENAIKNLQKKYHLREDGIVGSMTKMALYRSLPFLHLPNLKVEDYEPD
jgi:predicted double-glycine peptidase